MPEAHILTPIRELGAQRACEVDYLTSQGFTVPDKTGRYSINKGLLGTTIGGGETLNSWDYPPEDAFVDTVSPLRCARPPGRADAQLRATACPCALDGVAYGRRSS